MDFHLHGTHSEFRGWISNAWCTNMSLYTLHFHCLVSILYFLYMVLHVISSNVTFEGHILLKLTQNIALLELPFFYFCFANGGFPTLWAGLIPSGSKRSPVKPLWPPGGRTSRLNLRFLNRGEPGVDTKTSGSERGRNRGPDHLANPIGLLEPLSST